YLDLTLLERYWGEERVYHHTAPISMNYALREALRLVAEEGLAARFARHRANHEALAAGLASLGLAFASEEGHRLPMLNAVTVPDDMDEARVRRRLLDDLDLASLATAIERTVPVWERAGDAQSVAAARGLVAALEHETDARARRAIVGRLFQAVRVREPVLVTAYYEPELTARLKPDATFRHPLFRRPPDLVDVDPNAVDPTCRCGRLAGRLDGG